MNRLIHWVRSAAWPSFVFALVLVGCAGAAAPATGPAEVRLVAMSFLDPSRGWIAAKECAGGEQSSACRVRIYRTEDGGITWARAARFLLTPRAIQFVGERTGWLLGSIGSTCGGQTCPNAIMLSTDGGLRWDRVSSLSARLLDVASKSPLDAIAVGELCSDQPDCGSVLIKTVSGGQSWNNQPLPLKGRDFRLTVPGPNLTIVSASSSDGELLATSADAGTTWRVARSPCLGQAQRLSFRGPEGWMLCLAPPGGPVSGFSVFHSTDGGHTWSEIARPAPLTRTGPPSGDPSRPVTGSIAFPTSDRGWIVLGSGEVWRGADGGRSWTRAFETDERLTQIAFADPLHGWILGSQGVWRTADGGGSWQRVPVADRDWPILPGPPRRGSVE